MVTTFITFLAKLSMVFKPVFLQRIVYCDFFSTILTCSSFIVILVKMVPQVVLLHIFIVLGAILCHTFRSVSDPLPPQMSKLPVNKPTVFLSVPPHLREVIV